MNFVSLVWKGMLMSISQLIPGVSGSTIAIILGVYDRLLAAINNIWSDFRQHSRLLFGIGIGAVAGILLFSKIIKWLLEQYPVPLGLLFIGVIIGGAPLMYRKASESGLNHWNWIYFFIGFGIVLLMGMPVESNSEAIRTLDLQTGLLLFLGGIVFAIALILPGISGSFMLLVLGLYETLIVAADEKNLLILSVIGIGAVAGTLLTARAIETMLQRFPQQSYLLILGFILGSVFEIFPGWPVGVSEWLISVVVLIVGFWFVWKTSENA